MAVGGLSEFGGETIRSKYLSEVIGIPYVMSSKTLVWTNIIDVSRIRSAESSQSALLRYAYTRHLVGQKSSNYSVNNDLHVFWFKDPLSAI